MSDEAKKPEEEKEISVDDNEVISPEVEKAEESTPEVKEAEIEQTEVEEEKPKKECKSAKKCTCGIVKKLVSVFVVLLILGIIAGFIVYMNLGKAIRSGIEIVGPNALGAPVTVENIDLKPLNGKLELTNLFIGNPEGFKSDKAFSLGKVYVEMVPASLLSDTIHVKKILIEAPEVNYEMKGLTGSNVMTLKANVEKFLGMDAETAEEPEAEKPEPETSEGGKKVVIDFVDVVQGKVSLTIIGGKGLTVPLPEVHMVDVGKDDEDGMTIKEAFYKIFSSITDVVTKAGKAAGEGVGKAAEAVGDGAKSVIKGVKGLFNKD